MKKPSGRNFLIPTLIRIPVWLDSRLKARAKKNKWTQADIMRDGLERELDRLDELDGKRSDED